MRSYNETCEYDREELARLSVAEWQVNLLRLNPEYPHWGPYEDYMWNESDGWSGRMIVDTWNNLGVTLDELNEVVNFYFELDRENETCGTCGGSGYHPDCQWVSASFYQHSSPFYSPTAWDYARQRELHRRFGIETSKPVHGQGRGVFPSEETLSKYAPEFRVFCEAMRDGDGHWSDKITQAEADALIEAGRAGSMGTGDASTAEKINARQRKGGVETHDAINRSVLVRARCGRFEIPTTCTTCEGHGHVFTAESGHAGLVLWLLHPRKGASRGVHVKRIERDDLPHVLAFLRQAAQRNAERFGKLPPEAAA